MASFVCFFVWFFFFVFLLISSLSSIYLFVILSLPMTCSFGPSKVLGLLEVSAFLKAVFYVALLLVVVLAVGGVFAPCTYTQNKNLFSTLDAV